MEQTPTVRCVALVGFIRGTLRMVPGSEVTLTEAQARELEQRGIVRRAGSN